MYLGIELAYSYVLVILGIAPLVWVSGKTVKHTKHISPLSWGYIYQSVIHCTQVERSDEGDEERVVWCGRRDIR